MNSKKLNKLTKKYIEIVTKDFDKPFDKPLNKDNLILNQNGGNINEDNKNKDNSQQNIISINDILKLKKI